MVEGEKAEKKALRMLNKVWLKVKSLRRFHKVLRLKMRKQKKIFKNIQGHMAEGEI